MERKTGKMNYGKEDQIKGDLRPEDEIVMISIKMEGDLLDALKARAKEMCLPYQTMMKQMLRAQLAQGGGRVLGDEDRIEWLMREVAAIKAVVVAQKMKGQFSRAAKQPARTMKRKVG